MSEKINTRSGERGDITVRLSFPTRMGIGADKTPFANLVVTDVPSGTVIVEAEIPADQFTGMLGGSQATLTGAFLASPANLARVGKRSQNTSTDIRHADVSVAADLDVMALAVEADYLANGWETVRTDKTNYGRRVVAYRWID